MPEQLVKLCRVLGLELVGELQKLPPGSLVQRFGQQGALLEARARASNNQAARRDLFQIEIPAQIPHEILHLDQPTDALDVLIFLHKRTLQKLLEQVAQMRRAVATLELSLKLADWNAHQEQKQTVIKHQFRPARPTLDSRLLLDLLVLWLSTAPASDLVDTIEMRAIEVGRATPRQLRLFERQEDLADDAMKQAVSQLVATFGEHAICSPRLADQHQPEARIQWTPYARSAEQPAANSAGQTETPEVAGSELGAVLELIEPARPFSPHDVEIANRWGPHTLEGQWWTTDGYHRSYWILETVKGELLWIYQDKSGWYLQAYID